MSKDIEKIEKGLFEVQKKIELLESEYKLKLEHIIELGKRRDKWIFCIISISLSILIKSFM